MNDASSKNQGITLIAEFTDRAIRISPGNSSSANDAGETSGSRSLKEGIHQLTEFAAPVQKGRGTEQQVGERRRQVDPRTCEKAYSDEEIVFMKAMDEFKRSHRTPFPTWSEVLDVLRSLGYRKIEAATDPPMVPSSLKIQDG